MDKSPEAFRTISEVAEHLDTPAHVLRFWESRFPQIRPVKRAGGRRYYRPADVALLTGIKRLLHDEGMTIRGVQKILREQGVRHVSRLAGADEAEFALADEAGALEAALSERFGVDEAEPLAPLEAETAQVVALETALRRAGRAEPAPEAEAVESGAKVEAEPALVAEIAREIASWAAPEPEAAIEEITEFVALSEEGVVGWAEIPPPATIDQSAPEPKLDEPMANRLRARHARFAAPQNAALLPLRDRLAALHQRMVAQARPGGQ